MAEGLTGGPPGGSHDLAALLAGILAFVIKATAPGLAPRPWRAVFADALGTMALGWVIYRGALGVSASADIAFGVAGLCGALGWEVVRRKLLPKVIKKLEG